MVRTKGLAFSVFGLITALSSSSQAQTWELGGEFGVGAAHDPGVSGPTASAQSGYRTKATASVVWAENPFQYFGGEFRYMFRWGGPKLSGNGTQASMDGYANVITYDVLIHLKSRESRIRPYVAGGAGIKVYTATQPLSPQPLSDVALLLPGTQIEPAISAGGGVKCLLRQGIQFRIDFRTHMTPLPNDLIRPVGKAVIHGWSYDIVPMMGISYLF